MTRRPIVKEMGTLLSGNVLAQVISLAAYFALTRIFSAEDYGLYSIFYSYIEVLIIMSTCKYELALVAADSDREADALARYTLRLNAIVSTVLLTVALALWLLGALPGNFAQLGWIVLLIPPMVFFCGTSRVYSFLFNRRHRYRTMALSETVNAAAGALIKIALGLLGVLQAGLPVGTVAGRAVGNLVYRLKRSEVGSLKSEVGGLRSEVGGLRSEVGSLKSEVGSLKSEVGSLKSENSANERTDLRPLTSDLPSNLRPPTSDLRSVARKYRNYPRYVATKDFVNSFSANLPFLWLALYFDRADVGLFALALTFTFRPVNILNVAFEQVLFARTAERVRERQSVGRMTCRFLLVLNAVAVPLFVLAWFVAEPVFGFCFGGRWEGCGVYVRALLPWVFLSLSSTSLMYISNIFSTQRIEFGFYLVLLALRIAAIAVGIHAGSFLLAIRLYAAAGALVAASLLGWYLWQVRCYELTLRTC